MTPYLPLPLFTLLVTIVFASAWFAGEYVQRFIESEHCTPFLKRIFYAFVTIAWFRAAYALAVWVLQ